MEIIRGKMSLEIDLAGLAARMAGRQHTIIDLGTGDGRYVQSLADKHPGAFIIGVDACRENLRAASRRSCANSLFVIANACSLPRELYGLADQMTINFPWGSLLEGLLDNEPGLMAGLRAVLRPDARLDVHLNAGGFAEVGWPLEEGAARVWANLQAQGFGLRRPRRLDAKILRAYPSTWARRLAVGRDPRAVVLEGACR